MFRNLHCLALVALLVVPPSAEAQRQRGRERSDAPPRAESMQQRARTARAEALAPPRQLAQTLLPAGARRLPSSPVEMQRDNWRRWREHNRSWWTHQHLHINPFGYGSYYAVPYSTGGYYPATNQAEEPHLPPEPVSPVTNKGLLRLEGTPSTALDYYVDGVYIGSSSVLGTQFELNAGSRQVEIRARGYKSITIDMRIEEGRATTWRGALEPVDQPQLQRHTGSRVMYVIPGCYMGNHRPTASGLPAGCDVKKLVTRNGL